MSANPETFQSAWIADLLANTNVTPLLGSSKEVREVEWQGVDFSYPNIRVTLDYFPSIERCGPDDADIYLEIFDEQKSSKKATHIAAIIQQEYHGKPFTRNGIRFSTVIVRAIERPDRDIYGWQRRVKIFCQGI